MRIVAVIFTCLVIALHAAFAVAEMAYWQHPAVMERFGNTPAFAKASAVLAANQGIYNALFAAATLWALLTRNRSMLLVMLACIVVAGAYGAYSVKPTIFLVQSLPALLAMAATWLSARQTGSA